ncbi:MAG: protoporphyrinogen oxidase [Hyphomicrobiales bacterium]|nr:protoporphyrinogen oxidase [Hyphomicrobiales bacterium]
MKILIAYGSTEGQTRKITEALAAQICELGHEVEVFDTSGLPGGLHVESFDKIIVAGSVHDKQHQESLEIFVLSRLKQLQTMPTMFLSVSLAAAFEDGLAEAKGYVDSFLEKVGWCPTQSLLVAGAVRHGEYGYYREQILEHVVLEGRALDDPTSDHEFTDWAFLARSIAEFVET